MHQTVDVPVRAYALACDPAVNAVPRVQGWPDAVRVPTLRGTAYRYPADCAPAIVSHLRRLGSDLVVDIEPATRREGRVLLRAADRIVGRRRAVDGRDAGMLQAGSFQRG